MNQFFNTTKKSSINLPQNKQFAYRNSSISFLKLLDRVVIKDIIDADSSISEESDRSISADVKKCKIDENIRAKTILFKQTECQKIKYKLKIIDTTTLCLALSGLMLAIYDFEDTYNNDITLKYTDTNLTNNLRIFISFSTGICMILAVFRSITSYKLTRENKIFLEDQISDYYLSSDFGIMIIEIIIVGIHCPPYVDYEFEFKQYSGVLYISLSSICCSIMLLRILLIYRLFLHYSKWSSLNVQHVCQNNQVFSPLVFTLKACLNDSPYLLLIPLFILSTIALGIALQIYERPYNSFNGQTLNYTYLYNAE